MSIPKRAVILGATGMIGHRLWIELQSDLVVYGVAHRSLSEFEHYGIFSSDRVIQNTDVTRFDDFTGILEDLKPDVILNCVGITKRKPLIGKLSAAIEVNARMPHLLAEWASPRDIRVVHFSTDCVFDGSQGNYGEDDFPTATDTYGRTKGLGELWYDNAITIRSSFVGQELSGFSELLEWFLRHEGPQVKGFTNALYSGVSTLVMARVIRKILLEHQDLSGLFNLATSTPISKYDLLCCAKSSFSVDVEIEPDYEFCRNATLNGDKLRGILGEEVPCWRDMMDELAAERELYES